MQNRSQRRPGTAPRSRPFTRREPHSPLAPRKFEPVRPGWILKALASIICLALALAYGAVCLAFSRNEWQLALHPSRNVGATPASLGLGFTEVHFGDDASGQPQLDGWWIPAGAESAPTAILLHGGSGTMSDALPAARMLHDARLNVLLFDYRGFGHSAGPHPTEDLMQADAASAFDYLTATRGVPATSLVVYGEGLGASLAVKLCGEHAQIPALILESADGDLGTRVRSEIKSRLFPVGLLFDQTFPLAAPLRILPTPKLLISFTSGAAPPDFQSAANPKMLVETHSDDEAALQQSLNRFLSSYLRQPPTL